MINILNEIKWHYNATLGKIKSYLMYGSSIRLGEDPEFIEYLFTTKDGNLVCLNIIDETDIDDRYFIIFKGYPNYSILHPYVARIKITKPEYIKSKGLFSKQWVLSENEKRDLYNSLKSKKIWQKSNDLIAWKLLYERSEQDSQGVGWNINLDINYPSMPNYMELPNKI